MMVTANSCSSRPITPPMNSTGMNTAASDSVMDRMVKAISREPSRVACSGGLAHLQMARDVLQHDDGVVHHEAHAQGERHQRQVVHAVAEQVHHRERADDGHGQRRRRDQRGGEVAQEQEDHHDHQHQRQQQGELHVVHRFADGLRAVVQHLDVDARRDLRAELREQLADLVDHLDRVGAGLALDREDDAALVVVPGGHACRSARCRWHCPMSLSRTGAPLR